MIRDRGSVEWEAGIGHVQVDDGLAYALVDRVVRFGGCEYHVLEALTPDFARVEPIPTTTGSGEWTLVGGRRAVEGYAIGMRESYPGTCWRLLEGEYACIQERGHDDGAHEPTTDLADVVLVVNVEEPAGCYTAEVIAIRGDSFDVRVRMLPGTPPLVPGKLRFGFVAPEEPR